MKHPHLSLRLVGRALLAGLALAALPGNIQAQSDSALIDKLVAKGILSQNEAQELRNEEANKSTDSVASRLDMPSWVTGYKVSGDFRARYDDITSDNVAYNERARFRYRLRFGITATLLDNLEAGFRLASGTAGNALSANSTMTGDFSKKNIYIDAAFGRWTPIHSANWKTVITIGKMDNPFAFTPMVFDPDLTPEGIAAQNSWVINDKHTLSVAAAGFVLNESSLAVRDPYLFGGQALWTARWTKKFSTTAGVGGFEISHPDQLTFENVPANGNQGNTRAIVSIPQPTGTPLIAHSLVYQYAPIIVDASATYVLDSFPLYSGKFPIKVAGEAMQNVAIGHNNQAFWVGLTFGKSGTKKTWDISYRYEYLGSDAWYDQLVDDDNGVFWPGDMLGANSIPGFYGGTNIKGHMIKFNYSFTDSFTFTATCFINDLINQNGLTPNVLVPDTQTAAAIHVMADVMWKF